VTSAEIQVDRIASETIQIPIIGMTPLIVNRFGEKARRQLLDAEQGRKKLKTIRDPEADYQEAFYRMKDGSYGFPATAFKHATTASARFYGREVSMTGLRQALFVDGEMAADYSQALVPIIGEPVMREDYVRVGRGTDLRYRPMFPEWSATLIITYVTSLLSKESLLTKVEGGGVSCGVGEWRPEKGGPFGRFMLDPTRDVERIAG